MLINGHSDEKIVITPDFGGENEGKYRNGKGG